MQVVTLLILVFLLAALFGKRKSPYSRVIIGSVFGVFFFSIWPFFSYYADLYHWPELHKQIAFLVMGVTATLISVLLVLIRHELTVAIISFVAFVIVMVATFSAKVQIKNEIAIQSGFFKEITTNTSNKKLDSGITKFTYPVAGYQVYIPKHWQLRTDKGPEFQYFQIMKNGVLQAEFRPKCFEKDHIAITEIISNIQNKQLNTNQQTDVQCFYHGKSFYSCKISLFTEDKKVKRINWIGMRDDIQKGIELDFVLYESNSKIMQNINNIIASLLPVSGVKNGSGCLGLAEWF